MTESRSYNDTIVFFDKTDPKKIVCPHFFQLRWAKGCPYHCQWCYLQGTFFGKKEFRAYDRHDIERHIKSAFKLHKTPRIFNTGELSDSYPQHTNMRHYMDLFEGQRKHKILILTKTADTVELVKDSMTKGRKQTIYSCTVNATPVAEQYELDAPTPVKRLKSLKHVIEYGKGIQARCRLDPIVPIRNWKMHYSNIILKIANTGVKRVTIGTLRGLSRNLVFSRKMNKDNTWTDYLTTGDTGWGRKMDDETRREVYSHIIDNLRSAGIKEIAICKETVEMAGEFGMKVGNLRCNCVW